MYLLDRPSLLGWAQILTIFRHMAGDGWVVRRSEEHLLFRPPRGKVDRTIVTALAEYLDTVPADLPISAVLRDLLTRVGRLWQASAAGVSNRRSEVLSCFQSQRTTYSTRTCASQ